MTDADLARWEGEARAVYRAEPLSFEQREVCDALLIDAIPALIAEVRRLRDALCHGCGEAAPFEWDAERAVWWHLSAGAEPGAWFYASCTAGYAPAAPGVTTP